MPPTAIQAKTHFRINCRFSLPFSCIVFKVPSHSSELSNPVTFAPVLARSPERSINIPHPILHCQHLFSLFFKFFSLFLAFPNNKTGFFHNVRVLSYILGVLSVFATIGAEFSRKHERRRNKFFQRSVPICSKKSFPSSSLPTRVTVSVYSVLSNLSPAAATR